MCTSISRRTPTRRGQSVSIRRTSDRLLCVRLFRLREALKSDGQHVHSRTPNSRACSDGDASDRQRADCAAARVSLRELRVASRSGRQVLSCLRGDPKCNGPTGGRACSRRFAARACEIGRRAEHGGRQSKALSLSAMRGGSCRRSERAQLHVSVLRFVLRRRASGKRRTRATGIRDRFCRDAGRRGAAISRMAC
jgi:hypothetical protein